MRAVHGLPTFALTHNESETMVVGKMCGNITDMHEWFCGAFSLIDGGCAWAVPGLCCPQAW